MSNFFSFLFSSSEGNHLIDAVKRENEQEVLEIISRHKSSISTSHMDQAIVTAAKLSNNSMIQLLLEHGANHSAIYKGETPLFVSVSNKNDDGAKLLIDAGARLVDATVQDDSVQLLLCKNNMTKALQALLDKGVNFSEPLTFNYSFRNKSKKEFQVVPALEAAKYGSLEVIQCLKKVYGEETVDRIKDEESNSIILTAAMYGQTNILEYYQTQDKIHNFLNNRRRRNAVHLAAMNGHVESLHVILRNTEFDLEARDDRAQTALMLAIAENHVGTTKVLLDHKVLVNYGDPDGRTPLRIAHTVGNIEIVQLLFQAGAVESS